MQHWGQLWAACPQVPEPVHHHFVTIHYLAGATHSQPKPPKSALPFLTKYICLRVSETYFIRCSMKVCKDTSSVNMVCAFCAPTPPYAPVVWVVEGFSLDNRNRACEPPASQTMNRGRGKRSVMRSCHHWVSCGCSLPMDMTYSSILFRLFQ